MHIYKLLTLAAGTLICITPLVAQVRLHDAQRDSAAQDAKKIADQIQNTDLFQKQMTNLNLLNEKDVATTLADAKQEMTTAVDAFVKWSDLADLRNEISKNVQPTPTPDITAQKKQLDAQEDALNKQVAAISKTAGDSSTEVGQLANSIGQFQSALQFANDQLNSNQEAANKAISVLTQLQTLYKSYSDQMQVVNRTTAKLKDLQTNLKGALLARLKVEEDYLVAKAALYQRRENDLKTVRNLVKACQLPTQIAKDDRIDGTMEKLASARNRDALERASRVLFACTSLAAEGRLPDRLFRLRLAELEHLRSIQLSAANARVYESVFVGGVDRLALFYQGGIKPETLAQIVQALSTVGIFGKFVSQ